MQDGPDVPQALLAAQNRKFTLQGGQVTGVVYGGASHSTLFPAGLGPIHLSEVRCRGYERTLSDCLALEGSQTGCQHANDAAVRCNIPDMGFQNQVGLSLSMSSGRVWGAPGHNLEPGGGVQKNSYCFCHGGPSALGAGLKNSLLSPGPTQSPTDGRGTWGLAGIHIGPHSQVLSKLRKRVHQARATREQCWRASLGTVGKWLMSWKMVLTL